MARRPQYDSASSADDDDRAVASSSAVGSSSAASRRVAARSDTSSPPSRSPSVDRAPRGQLRARARQRTPTTRTPARRPPVRRVFHSDSDDEDDDEDEPQPTNTNKKKQRVPASRDSDMDDDEYDDDSAKEVVRRRRSSNSARPAVAKKVPNPRRASVDVLLRRKGSSSKKAVPARRVSSAKSKKRFNFDDDDADEDMEDSDADEDDVDQVMRSAHVDEEEDDDEEEVDDDDEEDDIRTTQKSRRGKVVKPSSARGSKGAKPKSRAKPSASKPRAKPTKESKTKSSSKTPESTGRRNPTRSTRGRHSLFENRDDTDDLLDSDTEQPVPSKRGSQLRDDEDFDNLAPSIAIHRSMEKILGRRLKRQTSFDVTNKAVEADPKSKASADKNDAEMNDAHPISKSGEKKSNKLNSVNNSRAADATKTKAETAGSGKHDEGAELDYEYLVKWKHLSYIHCEWVDEATVLQQAQGKARLRRFQHKQDYADIQRGQVQHLSLDAEEDELIPEDFVTVDRVLSDRINAHDGREYFVKWCSLPYADSTWELAEDVKDDNKISDYRKRNERPPEELLLPRPRPDASAYRPLPMPTFCNGGRLRDYQMEGFNWLVSCWFNRQGCILADEMGLGKTIQSVSCLNELFSGQKILGPFLVLAPLSTLGHWQREFQSWTNMNAIVYHGSSESRRIIQEYEWSYGTPQKGPPFKWHVMITTYETILQEANKLKHINWKVMVVDEAHRLKNRASRLVDELRNFKSEHRVLLTGTPIQNNSLEVWSLLNFLEPDKFMSEAEFAQQFGDIKDAETVDKLKALLRPFILRRLKEDVEKSIPPKEETIISVELTRVQKKWYRAMLEQNFSFLDKGAKSNNVGNLRNVVMELRKCSNHPYLIRGVEEIELGNMIPGADRSAHMRQLVAASGKMVLVDKLLPQLKKEGHRVLIFSQMIRVLDILEDYLVDKRWGYERIDGRVRGNDRQQAIDRYSKPDSDKFVFLLCTRAGGQGINLTCADTVIIYDSDWNPQNDVQAQARCHRIGQTTEVKIYRLITRGTYEQDMFDRASKKLGLDQAILQNMGKAEPIQSVSTPGNKSTNKSASLLNDMNRSDIDSLLKKGAYDVFNEDNAAADAFTSEDIVEILQRRSRVLRSTAADAGPSEFSKASFKVGEQGAGKGPDVALDDPDFWKKLMPEASAAPDPNIETLPRRRRQTVRYQPELDSDESDMDEVVSGDEGPAKLGPNGKRLFNKGERHRVQRALLSMGWGRWHEILEFAGSPVTDRRNVDDVAQFCKGLIRCCWEITLKSLSEDPKGKSKIKEIKERVSLVIAEAYASHRTIVGRVTKRTRHKRNTNGGKGKSGSEDDDDEDKEMQESEDEESDSEQEGEPDQYGNLLGPHDPSFVNFTDPILSAADYNSYFARNGTSILERMELLSGVRGLELDGSLCEGSEIPVVGASGSQALEPWWDTTFDRDLLRGTYKHGYGNYPAFLTDPNLCFLGRVQLPPVPRQGASRTNGNEADGAGSDSDRSGGEDSDSETRKKHQKKLSKSMSPDGDEHSNSESDEEQNSDGEQPTRFVPLDELKRRKWPPINVLNVRVRKLVRAFARMRKRAERVAKQTEENEKARLLKEEKRLAREQQREEQVAEKERKLAEANRHWSKKEKQDFSKYFSVVGAPPLDNNGKESWSLVKTRAGLSKKEPEVIQEYAKEFTAMCETMLIADEWCKKHKAPIQVYFDQFGPKQELNDDNDGNESKTNSRPKKKKGGSQFTLHQMEDARVTLVNAKKYTERRSMITTLRQEVLCDIQNDAVLQLLDNKGSPLGRERLPDWWSSNRRTVDVGLLQGVATHGFDSTMTALDESLPFRNLLAESVIEYIREKLDDHQRDGREFNQDDFVIPKTASDVADPDILTFFPKDKMIVSRTQRLINIVMKRDEEEGSPEPVGKVSKSKSGIKTLQRKRSVPPEDEDVKHSAKKGAKGKVFKPDGSLLCPLDDGVLGGAVPSAFENVPIDRMTRKLLKFLKQQKKTHANATLKLELPDWIPEDQEFGRVNADGTDYFPEGKRPSKRRRLTGNGCSQQGNTRNEGANGAGNLNAKSSKDQRVIESSMYKVQRDADNNIIFPIKLGVLSIESLGQVDPTRRLFHTDRTIYPIGFRSVREYTSMVDISRQCQYVCEILDDGGPGPVFQVTCLDGDTPVKKKDSSSSACWTYVMTAIRDSTPEDRKRLHTTVSGPEYFGLSNPVVQELVQDLPGSDECERYVRKIFVSSAKPRRGDVKEKARKAAQAKERKGKDEGDENESQVGRAKSRPLRKPKRYRDADEEAGTEKAESPTKNVADARESNADQENEQDGSPDPMAESSPDPDAGSPPVDDGDAEADIVG